MKPLALRKRLSLLAAVTFGLVLSVVGGGVALHLHTEIKNKVRRDLTHESKAFFTIYQEHQAGWDWNNVRQVQNEVARGPMFHPFEIFNAEQKSLYRSLGMGRIQVNDLHWEPGFYVETFSGRKYIVGVFKGDGLIMKVVGDMDNVDEIGFDLLVSFLTAGPVMLGLGALGSWWLLRRAFLPVDQMVDAAERITAQRLNERLPVPEIEDEIGRLALVFNRMIDRLQVSFKQATRFTADASHELKTPLTIIRGEIEARLNKNPDPETQKLLLSVLEQTNRLSSITEKLLLLSRADAGKLPLHLAQIDLSAMLADLIEDAEILGSRLGLSIEANIAPDVEFEGDRDFLQRLLLNLFDNAAKYNRSGGSIWVDLIERPEEVEVRVANTSQGIPFEQAGSVFDRFFRGFQPDDATEGQGLGLSLCREIAVAHGGTVSLYSGAAERTEFRLILPKTQVFSAKNEPNVVSANAVNLSFSAGKEAETREARDSKLVTKLH